MRVTDSEGITVPNNETGAPRGPRPDKVSTNIAREIVRDIAARKLPTGARLAPEQQMLDTYGVGRASLREALRLLEAQGIVWIKSGPRGGPVVGNPGAQEFGRTATMYFQMHGATLRELAESRLLIEPLMAGFAARLHPPDLERRLEAAAVDPNDISSMTDAQYVHTAGEFHAVITGMSGNKVLDLFSRSLKSIYDERVGGCTFPVEQRREALHDHQVVASAILRGDAEEAERLMREHMKLFVHYLTERYPGLLDEIIDWTS